MESGGWPLPSLHVERGTGLEPATTAWKAGGSGSYLMLEFAKILCQARCPVDLPRDRALYLYCT